MSKKKISKSLESKSIFRFVLQLIIFPRCRSCAVLFHATKKHKLRQISTWIKEMFPKYEKLTFDRCHFTSFGQSAFNFELVFWVEDADYNLYMDLQQSLLFDIYSKLSKEDVQLGLPTSNIHIDAAEKLFESQPSPQLL